MLHTSRRVVVTGIGIISPLGLNQSTTWNNLLNGKSGVSTIKHFDTSSLACHVGGIIKGFTLHSFKTKHIHRMDPFIQYGLQAAQEAIIDANLQQGTINKERVGVNIGSGIGGLTLIEKQYKNLIKTDTSDNVSFRSTSPFFIPGMLANMLSGLCAMEYGFQGPNFSVMSACATGAHNIGIGARCIADGDAEVMIVGGAEVATTPLSVAGFSVCRALSTYHCPTQASRPWDQARDGFVLSDGASVLVLELYEHAIKRGANIYGEILGFGMSADAYDITAPEPSGRGAIMAMQNALRDAELKPQQIDYINAHATSTLLGDTAEIKAIKKIWDTQSTQLKISATKSMTGHLLGAAGSLEAAFCLLAIRDQIAPPTINLENPEPICEGLNLVPHIAQPSKINIALSNAFGFGGTNCSLIFSKV